MRRHATATSLGIAGVAAVAMAATGVFAYHNIKQLNRYETSDDVEKYQADYERKYLKYEKLPQPSIAHVKLDVQLYPEAAAADRRRAATIWSTSPMRRSATFMFATGDRDTNFTTP